MTVELQAEQMRHKSLGHKSRHGHQRQRARPDPHDFKDPNDQKATESALKYMGLKPGTPITDISVDRVFIGSCHQFAPRRSSRRRASRRRKTRREIHQAGAHRSRLARNQSRGGKRRPRQDFTEAGFEWRDAGCSMCIGMNADVLPPHERSASTSNRNFEGRQGRDSRTHLVSPVMAAAARPRWTLRRCPFIRRGHVE